MNQNKSNLRDDIEKAEKNILIVSWLGIAFTIGFIVSLLLNT